jgi:hypothetical protein
MELKSPTIGVGLEYCALPPSLSTYVSLQIRFPTHSVFRGFGTSSTYSILGRHYAGKRKYEDPVYACVDPSHGHVCL